MRKPLVAVPFFALLFSLSVQTEQDRAPLGIDEKLSEPGYLISVPAVIHPSLPRYLYRLYADDNGYPERIDVLDEQSKRVIQRMEWPNGQALRHLDTATCASCESSMKAGRTGYCMRSTRGEPRFFYWAATRLETIAGTKNTFRSPTRSTTSTFGN